MSPVWWLSYVLLWMLVVLMGFLLFGALRVLGLQGWRLEQLEATTPGRVGRGGLKPGTKAPDFTLPAAAGGEVSLHDFAGRRVLLVFMQSGCGPCERLVPDLNRLQQAGAAQVVVVNNGEPRQTREWADGARVSFPVAAQENYSLSRRYESFATPFAFFIDEQGVIGSRGVVNNRRHLEYVIEGTRPAAKVPDRKRSYVRGPTPDAAGTGPIST